MLKKAVLFLVFNRPDTTKKVFEAIREARPPRLYVAADGARENKVGEKEKCAEVRKIVENVDWECEVKTLFRDKNLGCGVAVSGAIDWFFENEEDGIILEDDCFPSQDFFCYCEELLDYYANDTRIGLISGFNIKSEYKSDTNDYFFSNLGGIWGWASWRRVWKYFSYDLIKLWKDDNIKELFKNHYGIEFYNNRNSVYNSLLENKIDIWDYYFGFVRALNSFIAVVPSKNLIKNIGFASDATHTTSSDPYLEGLKTFNDIQFPLKKNGIIIPDFNYDYFFLNRKEFKKNTKNIEIESLSYLNVKVDKIIDTLAWWIPIRKWRYKFRKKFN